MDNTPIDMTSADSARQRLHAWVESAHIQNGIIAVIGKDLQDGRLQAVLSEYIPVERYVYAKYLPSRHLPVKVRAFIDFMIARIGTEPYWDRDNMTVVMATGLAARTVVS